MSVTSLQRIVVLGGSFNPPTLAHMRLLQSALDGLSADLGIFVPSSHGYVRRKMKRTSHPNEVLSDRLRLDMLHAMCRSDSRLTVCDAELDSDNGAGQTYETMSAIAQQYPGAELYFIFGADKLNGLPRWRTFEPFVRDFRLLIFSRDGFNPEAIFESNTRLAAHRDAFVFLPQPDGTEDISSTKVRDLLRSGGNPSAMLHPDAAKLLLSACPDEESAPAVMTFKGQYGFLSNFFKVPVVWEGLTYQNSEAAFQAAKLLTMEERLPFTSLPPNVAKRMGRQVPLRPNWEDVKVGIMEDIVRAKFTQNPELGEKLLATGEMPIFEGNTWGDTFWGIDLRTERGKNHLGKILMKIRSELRTGQ